MDENKEKALKAALAQIEKQFGKNTIMHLGDETAKLDADVVSTGSLGLDIALGIGGLPKGRIIEIFGPESSGKTTLTLQTIAECQKQGGTCAFIDAEHALDPIYAKKLGVDIDALLVSQPDNGEQALEIADMLVRSGAIDMIVVDSVAALTPKAEIEGEMGDSHMGLQARLMSQALRKITGNAKRSNCMVIFINQIRMKIGVMFGSPETTTGGNALKFYASVRLDIRRQKAKKSSAQKRASKSSKTKWRLRFAKPNSKSSTVRASTAWVRSSIWVWTSALSANQAHGTAMATAKSAKVKPIPSNTYKKTLPSPLRSRPRCAKRSLPPSLRHLQTSLMRCLNLSKAWKMATPFNQA